MKRSFAVMAAVAASSIVLIVAAPVVAQSAGSPAATAPVPGPAPRAAAKPATAPASMPAIRIGYDTTRITKPLKPDGTVDYMAAINEMYSKGVTKDNNAAVLLIQVLGSVMFPDEIRHEAFKRLGVQLQSNQKFLDLKVLDAKVLEKAAKNTWSAKDFPEIAKWLQENKELLAKVTEATRRSRYFWPCVVPTADKTLWDALMPSMQHHMTLARVLLARANLALQERRVDDAWSDTLSVYRLSNLLNQDRTLIGRLAAAAMSGVADGSAQRIAASGLVTSDAVRRFMTELIALGPTPQVAESIDVGERFTCLDLAPAKSEVWVRTIATLQRSDPDGDDAQLLQFRFDMLESRIDRNSILVAVNRHYDRMIQAYKETDLKKRAEALAAILKTLEETKHAVLPMPGASSTKEETSAWAANFFSLFMVYLPRAQFFADRSQVSRELTILSLALAAYKADDSKYPARLADLSSKHIKAVPTDFFAGGKEFVYRVTKDGYVLYSVGENGKDDGGMDYSSGKEGADDLVVRVPAVSADSKPASRP